MSLRYRLVFTSTAGRFELVDEALFPATPTGDTVPYLYYSYGEGEPILNKGGHAERKLARQRISTQQSILSQRKDADLYPELTYTGDCFTGLKFFREWNLGRSTAPRLPQKVDLPEDFLLEDASNLGLVLNNLLSDPSTKQNLLGHLRSLYEEVEDVATKLQGGTVQVFFHERGLTRPVPATRLSDGTLHFLCLLAILCHPDPPPVVCIEEPEVGLHPDAITAVAELLIEASERTQLIVTTHSDVLVSALSEVPEAVIVTERDATGTRLRRLERENLTDWLDKYRLGEVWMAGELGRKDVERVRKPDLMKGLERATRDTRKGRYHKIHHGPKVLGRLDPDKVRERAPHCDRLFQTLETRITGTA